ncbi:hypothetical protein ACFIOY_02120 [Bradyrhizobium sp. TZ2]
MLKKTGWLSAGLTLAAFSALASFALGGVGSAQAAVVYCKTVGVPKGCVVRPTPVAAAAVVTPAVGVARVGVGAPGVGVRAGTPMNRGGPVNRVGRR